MDRILRIECLDWTEGKAINRAIAETLSQARAETHAPVISIAFDDDGSVWNSWEVPPIFIKARTSAYDRALAKW